MDSNWEVESQSDDELDFYASKRPDCKSRPILCAQLTSPHLAAYLVNTTSWWDEFVFSLNYVQTVVQAHWILWVSMSWETRQMIAENKLMTDTWNHSAVSIGTLSVFCLSCGLPQSSWRMCGERLRFTLNWVWLSLCLLPYYSRRGCQHAFL